MTNDELRANGGRTVNTPRGLGTAHRNLVRRDCGACDRRIPVDGYCATVELIEHFCNGCCDLNLKTCEQCGTQNRPCDLVVCDNVVEKKDGWIIRRCGKIICYACAAPETITDAIRCPDCKREPEMTSRHTQGPWTIIKPKLPVGPDKEGDRLIGRAETKEHIAEVYQYRNDSHKDEATSLANARLIKAAPCLFETLVNLLSLCQCEYPKSVWHGPDAWSEAIAARAVIAEVESPTP